jgi:anhydro-N-acetylmuramic acid kinase
MSGSSLDGLDLVFAELQHNAGKWSFELVAADCRPYPAEWVEKLKGAIHLSALEYQLLHSEYGHYLGQQVNQFIEAHNLHYKVGVIASHGHTTFHRPPLMTAQLGDGAAIAAETGLPVVSDLRALDVAFGGQGAPIVPIGEKLLFPDYSMYLNLGGIANISINQPGRYIAFDVCPANRVLNMLIAPAGKEYDAGGALAATGSVHAGLLMKLNDFEYYRQPYPKSLANNFGTDEVFPLVNSFGLPIEDALRTYVEHIVLQIRKSVETWRTEHQPSGKLLVTGGGAFNNFMMVRLREELQPPGIEVVVPDKAIVESKEALVMALIGVLRWRQEYNVLSSVTGARRDSIGGALWNGQEA